LRVTAMKMVEMYMNLYGQEIPVSGMDAEERRLLARLRRRCRTHADWADFNGYWMREVAALYDERGLTRTQTRQKPIYRIAQDLCSRLGIAVGLVRPPDYRTEVEELIRLKFQTRRAFCQATGLSEDMLSHFLAGRKDMSLASLGDALARIGYRIGVVPAEPAMRTG
jgi:hypothetical protein